MAVPTADSEACPPPGRPLPSGTAPRPGHQGRGQPGVRAWQTLFPPPPPLPIAPGRAQPGARRSLRGAGSGARPRRLTAPGSNGSGAGPRGAGMRRDPPAPHPTPSGAGAAPAPPSLSLRAVPGAGCGGSPAWRGRGSLCGGGGEQRCRRSHPEASICLRGKTEACLGLGGALGSQRPPLLLLCLALSLLACPLPAEAGLGIPSGCSHPHRRAPYPSDHRLPHLRGDTSYPRTPRISFSIRGMHQ